MKPRKLSCIFIFASVVACGAEVANETPNGESSEGASSSESPRAGERVASSDATCGPAAVARCSPPLHIASAEALVDEAKKLSWQGVALGRAAALEVGPDLVADADLVVDASTLVGPADCPTTADDGFPRCNAPLFREFAFPQWAGKSLETGTSCLVAGGHPMRKGDTCERLAIEKGTAFRLRAVVEDMHPTAPTYWPFIEIERPCTAECAADERRCEATQTCFGAGFASCAYCEAAPMSVCACREGCSSRADGAECSFDTSPDTAVIGTCKAGSCVVP